MEAFLIIWNKKQIQESCDCFFDETSQLLKYKESESFNINDGKVTASSPLELESRNFEVKALLTKNQKKIPADAHRVVIKTNSSIRFEVIQTTRSDWPSILAFLEKKSSLAPKEPQEQAKQAIIGTAVLLFVLLGFFFLKK